MCGISGWMGLKGQRAELKFVQPMIKVLSHRGPDDEGVYIKDNIGLGHKRLSILDLSSAGHQPMLGKENRRAIVLNGEIYNYIELKKELGGNYKSLSDTEVLLRAYEKWGEDCLEKLNGIFAFAIWDVEKKQLFAARDRLGVKPLYYAINNNIFYFASEIKSLLAAGIKAEPNDKIIYDYLIHGYYEHSEETFFKGIKQLMPGHSLVLHNDRLKIKCYWHLPEQIQDLSGLNNNEIGERYRALVNHSVSIQMRSDVPIGINASGGLDCSILTRVVNEICSGQKNFHLYSWIYGNEKYDEAPYVRKLADYLGWQAEFFKLTPQLTIELMPKVVKYEEQPFPGISIVARHYLYQQVDKETIVFLEGHGGDEIGGGYRYYFSSFILDIIGKYGVERAKKEFGAYAHTIGLKNDSEIFHFFLNGLKSCFKGGMSADATSFSSASYLNKDFLDVNKNAGIPQFESSFGSFLSNMQYRDLHWTKLPRVLRSVDRNSMAYGREVRVPFLDHNIVEFAFSLPFTQKIHNGEERFFMRNAYRKKLDCQNVSLPKRAVPDPQRDWLKGEMKPWVEEILFSSSFGRRGYFDQNKVAEEYGRYCHTSNALNSFHIWQWINLELWFRAFFD